MKFNLVLLTLIVVFVSLSGCKDVKTGIVIPEKVEKYPTDLNTEWEYETTTYFARYDKFGNPGEDSLAWPISHAVVKITSVNDSVYGEKNLIRFDLATDRAYSSGTNWYRNNNLTLELVAYSGMWTDWVAPMKGKSNKLAYIKYLSSNLLPDRTLFSINDSVYLNKRIVLEYPLTVGKSWDVYGPNSFSITKTIIDKLQLDYSGTNIECFDIKSFYNSIRGIDVHDYISMELGLVKRETIIDSVELSTTEDPAGIGEFYKYKSFSTLIRKSK